MSGFLDLNRSDSIGCQVGFKEIYIGQKKRLIVSVNVFGSVRKKTEKHYLG